MNLLIAYDIADPRRLQRVAKIMQDYGVRVQKSIFEVDVSARMFGVLRKRIEAVMDHQEDGVKYYPTCKRCEGAWLTLGEGDGERLEGPWVII